MKKKNPWLVFDTEDNGMDPGARKKVITQVHARMYNGKVFYSASKDCVDEFKSFLMRESMSAKNLTCWAHNARYDLGNLFWDCLDDLNWRFVDNKFIRAWGLGSIVFLDSMNIFPESLEKLGMQTGLKKLKPKSTSEKKYIFRDVQILWNVIDELYSFCKLYGVEPGSTISSTSVRIWKSMGGENWNCDSPFFKEAYYGGRTEIFTPEFDGLVAHTDINSLYAWALTQKFPDPVTQGGTIDQEGIASVRVTVPESNLTVLPVRAPDQKILYPWGTFNGWWTTLELREAIKRGARIDKIFNLFTSKTNSFYYRNFAKEMYEKRLNCEDPYRKKMFKQVLNSFSGQLASRGIMQTTAKITEERLKKPGLVFGNKILVEIRPKLPKQVNFLHAAYITSYARIKLLEYIEKIGVENMLYCGTDACIFRVKDEKSIPFEISDDLGEMKIEGLAQGAQAKDISHYRVGSKYVAKGVPASVAREYFEYGLARYMEPVGFHASVKFGKQMSQWEHRTKEKYSQYSKKRFINGIYLPKKIIYRKYHQKTDFSNFSLLNKEESRTRKLYKPKQNKNNDNRTSRTQTRNIRTRKPGIQGRSQATG